MAASPLNDGIQLINPTATPYRDAVLSSVDAVVRWRQAHRRVVRDGAIIVGTLLFIPTVALLGLTLIQ